MSIPEQDLLRGLCYIRFSRLEFLILFSPILETYYYSYSNFHLWEISCSVSLWVSVSVSGLSHSYSPSLSPCVQLSTLALFSCTIYCLPNLLSGLGIMATIYSEDMPIASGRRIAWISVPLVILYWGLAYIGNSKDYQMMIHSAFWGSSPLCVCSYFKVSSSSEWMAFGSPSNGRQSRFQMYATKYGHLNPAGQVNKKESYLTEVARRQLEKKFWPCRTHRFRSVWVPERRVRNEASNSFAMTNSFCNGIRVI
ncbi:hypothetical protein BC829DRAFT_280744 [Chytridium lagenaria]|nr:hypothetical protein BC829DRAFT_280744 [Chytridium lagenaria]